MSKDRESELVSAGLQTRADLASGELVNIFLSGRVEAVGKALDLLNFDIQDLIVDRSSDSLEVVLQCLVKDTQQEVQVPLTNEQLGLLRERYLIFEYSRR